MGDSRITFVEVRAGNTLFLSSQLVCFQFWLIKMNVYPNWTKQKSLPVLRDKHNYLHKKLPFSTQLCLMDMKTLTKRELSSKLQTYEKNTQTARFKISLSRKQHLDSLFFICSQFFPKVYFGFLDAKEDIAVSIYLPNFINRLRRLCRNECEFPCHLS